MRRWISFAAARTATAVVASPARLYSTPGKVKVVVKTQDGTSLDFEAPTGMSLMHALRDVAMLEVEGACDGCMQCSTCHVYLSAEYYKKLKEPAEQEQDVLDKALDVKDTSRLACQIPLTPEIDGIELALPTRVVNLLM
ncbi:putative mitochondrial Adrenodoxin-like protein [Leptomonas pyrrhocoris]|uniref:Putative mitochondrial Adrenodoxin-like protein n=1 Tax=Leptomonas pyrrhocoris TaxID=157538 RepID=A0A0M9FRA4_LEPPY|nr:putative mitochondrial Adrenodoxin-like protein [Leptomonas pyrrhocoris]XP_015652895.1 putative mitochondrial Adrenodoxin-like protein [Leptomonas pyrrhocoris]KPA74455.1 putative mitochondrial Adrenodoxin-like protein [Leptomonas pyrrhocoris]KPA74456.1 putative mitochondrial Adrenodoxin-like protein [Leptomonas pyrrhocoris]|eukprot:XP_015652894.1 putative mitochondrial Adrenodoxin-like protein [Leptomonas pyrrhocoris]